jgi:hypothetical protein
MSMSFVRPRNAWAAASLAGILLGASVAGCATAAPPPSASVEITVPLAPPAPRYETVVPASRPDRMVWDPGHWRWNGRQYVWIPGHYLEKPRRTAVWVPGQWMARHRGWVWVEGHWG